MKIAILIYGQPRFFDKTVKLIKDEFTLPDIHPTGPDARHRKGAWDQACDFFIHSWNNIGHTPECDQRETFDDEINTNYIKYCLEPKSYIIGDYNEITEYTKAYLNVIEPLRINRRIPYDEDEKLERYFFGQHLSILNCYKEIVKYEKKYKFTYDIIIKARTDIIYKHKKLYTDDRQYIKDKVDTYIINQHDIPIARANGIRINKLKNNKWDGTILKEYYNNKCIEADNNDNTFQYKQTYWERLCMNDWLLITNRKGATYFFSKWFETFLTTLSKDLLLNKLDHAGPKRWMARSDHTMQGCIAYNYNIKLEKIPCKRRDRKIISSEKVKTNVDVTNKILLRKSDDLKILENKIKKSFL